jgi:hypothetical protein
MKSQVFRLPNKPVYRIAVPLNEAMGTGMNGARLRARSIVSVPVRTSRGRS